MKPIFENMDSDKIDKKICIKYKGQQITLMEYMETIRNDKKISKTYISKIIKRNDYWYSQIAYDYERTKYIKLDDLVNVISVIIFDCKSYENLEEYNRDSLDYIYTNMFSNIIESSNKDNMSLTQTLDLLNSLNGKRTLRENYFKKVVNCKTYRLSDNQLELLISYFENL